MIGYCVLLIVNYPSVDLQHKIINSHAQAAFLMVSIVFAAGAFTGVVKNSGMLASMTDALVSIIPTSMGTFIAPIVGLFSVPLSLLFDPDSYYYGVMPVIANAVSAMGGNALAVAKASIMGQMTLGFPLSPLTGATFLLLGLSGQDLGDHQKHTLPYAWVASAIMVAVGCYSEVSPKETPSSFFTHSFILIPKRLPGGVPAARHGMRANQQTSTRCSGWCRLVLPFLKDTTLPLGQKGVFSYARAHPDSYSCGGRTGRTGAAAGTESVDCRPAFLSSALEQLKPIPVPALDTLFAGDGHRLYYCPETLLRTFRAQQSVPTRALLHVTLHFFFWGIPFNGRKWITAYGTLPATLPQRKSSGNWRFPPAPCRMMLHRTAGAAACRMPALT